MKDFLISVAQGLVGGIGEANFLAQGLVEDPSAVSVDVDEPNEEGVTVMHLHVADDDKGRVIGKQGRIAKAIRIVMRAAASRNNTKVMVEID